MYKVRRNVSKFAEWHRMLKKVGLIGYSGHAMVVADTLQQLGYEICGYFEKYPVKNNPFNLHYLGYERNAEFLNNAKGLFLFPAIGDNQARKNVLEFLNKSSSLVLTVISVRANVSILSSISTGTLVCQGACINAYANIGCGVIINTGAIIEHECSIGDYSHVAPGAVLAGDVQIGKSVFIGANAVIKQGIKIGNNVIVGAGSVVINDLPDRGIWVGNPAKEIIRK